MNSQLSTRHLSEEALHDELIGMGTQASGEHLAVCELCRSRVDAFRSDLALFNQASLAASQSASQSARQSPSQSTNQSTSTALAAMRRQQRLTSPRPLAWSAATAALLLAAAAAWNYQHAPVVPAQPIAAEFADSPDQIADDNQLLRNVYNALDEEPQSPVNEFSIAQSIAGTPIPGTPISGTPAGSPARSFGTPSKARTQ